MTYLTDEIVQTAAKTLWMWYFNKKSLSAYDELPQWAREGWQEGATTILESVASAMYAEGARAAADYIDYANSLSNLSDAECTEEENDIWYEYDESGASIQEFIRNFANKLEAKEDDE